jgi:hypothetical protein
MPHEFRQHAGTFRGIIVFHSATTVAYQSDSMRQAIISLALLALLASATPTTAEPQAVSQGNDAIPVLYNRRMLTFGFFHPWFQHSLVSKSSETLKPAQVTCNAHCSQHAARNAWVTFCCASFDANDRVRFALAVQDHQAC